MKKRMKNKIATLLVAAMALMTLVACGNTDVPANATIESTNDTTNDATNETPIEDGIVESGNLDNVPSTEEDVGEDEKVLSDKGVRYNYTKAFALSGFETTAEAWDIIWPFLNDESNGEHINYFLNEDGDVMTFVWFGPTSVQGTCVMADNTFEITSSNKNYRLIMWHSGAMFDESELMRNLDEGTIMSWTTTTPIEGTFQVEENENSYRVIFKVTNMSDSNAYIGYACFIDYLDRMEGYQFVYLVEESLFDEDEALAVVKSIEYANLDDYNVE